MSNTTIITYSCDTEILICAKATEKRLLKEYFSKGCGRSLDEYERSETAQIVEIKPRLLCS